jgi:cell division protein FtsL
VAPARPRRVSGPARPARGVPGGERTRPAPPRGLAVAALDALRGLSNHRLLERLIAGKAWIGVVAFALIGIVTLQLGLLQLNRGIGRALERESMLQSQNAALSVENSEMASGDRVESQAQGQGMEIVSPGALRFLSARHGGEIAGAAAALSAPIHAAAPGGEAPASPTASSPMGAEGTSTAGASAATGAGTGTGAGASPQGSETAGSGSQTAPAGEAGAAPAGTSAPAPAPAAGRSEAGTAAASTAATPAGGTQASPSR